eukprot:gene10877-19700_t
MEAREWTAIVLTVQDQATAQAFLKELESRQNKGYISKSTLLLCVEDPHCKVGSGGATLNALLVVAEHLSAQSGHTGTHFPFSACQRGFTALPIEVCQSGFDSSNQCEITCIFDLYLSIIMPKLAHDAPDGLWICSTDRVLYLPDQINICWNDAADVRVFTVLKNPEDVALSNGACKVSESGDVQDIIYNGSQKDVEACILSEGKVPTLFGVVFMTTTVAEALLALHVQAPLEACTYMGVDSAVKPVKNLSLFYDMLLAMATGVQEGDFVAGRRSGEFSTRPLQLDGFDKQNRKMARQLLWDTLQGYSMKAVNIKEGDFHYMYSCARDLHNIMVNTNYCQASIGKRVVPKRHLNAVVHDGIAESNTTIINSIVKQAQLGEGTVVCHSHIHERVSIGERSLILNLVPGDLQLSTAGKKIDKELVIQGLTIRLPSGRSHSVTGTQRVLIILGLHDNLTMDVNDQRSTFCNASWDSFFNRTGIMAQELWSTNTGGRKNLMNARLFPIFSPGDSLDFLDLLWLQGSDSDPTRLLKWRNSWRLSMADIVNIYDVESELSARRNLLYSIGKKLTKEALIGGHDRCLLPFFRYCILEGYFEEILSVLDNVASQNKENQRAVLSRTFACIADIIGDKAQNKGGLRSGPASNLSWQKGFELLEQDKIADAVSFFAKERQSWLSRPDLLVRAARHYEGAFQVQVRKAVGTARQFIQLKSCQPVPIGKSVIAEAPARVDIAGTWSDTPPICYEHGGSVITAGVKIDSKKPIGCRVKRLAEPYIVLVLGKGDSNLRLECRELEEMANYRQVNSPGTLLKAAFFCAGILTHNSNSSLESHLKENYGGGFELQTWSDLPHGSGLGTSSILAGTIMAALWRSIGKEPDVDSVIHAVLDLEQLMTTGGGWQDNVGGLAPGIKEGSSKRGLPLKVTATPLSMPQGFLEHFEKHLILIFSGKTRLARNMLQDVLRNWNARFPAIVNTADQLVENAKNCIQAFEKGDLEGIGETMNVCWRHKKLMAHGCEPKICKIIMDAISPLAYGQCLAGAGGGGFLYVITKNANAAKELSSKLAELGDIGRKTSVHSVEIDKQGLTVKVEDN